MVTTSQLGDYSVVVTNSVGATVSREARLTFPRKVLSASVQTSGEFQAVLGGEPGDQYEIQATSDLAAWRTLTNLHNLTGTVQFSDAVSPTAVARFYRALRNP
jgi:hypothetical protein